MSTGVPRRIAVDFDGTLCGFAYPEIGELKQGAKEALTLFRQLGYTIVIYSCRTCKWDSDIFARNERELTAPIMERQCVREMKAYLDQHGIPYDLIDDGSKGKPVADFYIDDKGIRFQDNWDEIAKAIHWVTISKGVFINSPTSAAVNI